MCVCVCVCSLLQLGRFFCLNLFCIPLLTVVTMLTIINRWQFTLQARWAQALGPTVKMQDFQPMSQTPE